MDAIMRLWHKPELKYFRLPVFVMLLAWGVMGGLRGPLFVLTTIVLTGVEVTYSLDNATIDAKLLAKMSPRWQKVFYIVGPIVGVCGVRLLFPIFIVAVTTGLGFGHVWREAFAHQHLYALHLAGAHHYIVALAVPYLALTFLEWAMADDKSDHWPFMGWVERMLASLGRRTDGPKAFVLAVIVVAYIVTREQDMLVFESLSWAMFCSIDMLNKHMKKDDVTDGYYMGSRLTMAIRKFQGREFNVVVRPKRNSGLLVALGRFAMLELVDASFSLDSVSGAFAISTDFIAILIGLGIGAFYVRAFTMMAVEHKMLGEYKWLENGAHWSIGLLASAMIVSCLTDVVPQMAVGAGSLGIIGVAVVTSIMHKRRKGTPPPPVVVAT